MSSSEVKPGRGVEAETFRFPDLLEPETPLQISRPCFETWGFADPEVQEEEQGEEQLTPEELLAQARQRAQEIEQQAYEEGFRQGQADGLEVGRRALKEAIRRVEALVANLEQEREELFRHREQDLVELALLVAERLLLKELELHPEAIREIIREGFRQISRQETLRLWVSPPDFELLQQEAAADWPPGVELRPDPGLSPGGFRLETALGEVDGTRETRWALIAEAVRQAAEVVYASSHQD